jgi:hypothetical protein
VKAAWTVFGTGGLIAAVALFGTLLPATVHTVLVVILIPIMIVEVVTIIRVVVTGGNEGMSMSWRTIPAELSGSRRLIPIAIAATVVVPKFFHPSWLISDMEPFYALLFTWFGVSSLRQLRNHRLAIDAMAASIAADRLAP